MHEVSAAEAERALLALRDPDGMYRRRCIERVIDGVVPKDWARGGRGASKERPRWGVECAPNIRNGFEVVLDSRPGNRWDL